MSINDRIFNLQSGEALYFKDVFENLAVCVTNNGGTLEATAKHKKKEEFVADFTSELIYNARLAGELISKAEYNGY